MLQKQLLENFKKLYIFSSDDLLCMYCEDDDLCMALVQWLLALHFLFYSLLEMLHTVFKLARKKVL